MKTPIVFAINESYYKQLETVIVSILENSQSNFEFIVLSKGLPEFCKDAIGKKGREIVSIYRRDARYRIEIFGKCVYSKRVEVEIF